MSFENYGSWGRYPVDKPKDVIKFNWRNELPLFDSIKGSVLPYGMGKSYGDSCQNRDGTLIDIQNLAKFISFDKENGILRVEAGITLETILKIVLPLGWFLPVTPGTKLITVAGAVANDVHGKNHHKAGTFGCHVLKFELIRSDGSKEICSELENADMFRATIGGLGLTGLITWVEFKLKPCPSEFIIMDSIKFDSLDEFFVINNDSDKDFEYTVSWVDCTTSGSKLGRGLFSRGNHASPGKYNLPKIPKSNTKNFPFDAPFINPLTVNLFNMLYFNKQFNRIETKITHYDPFFYPLDAVQNWNKAYGKNGFLQYQFVIPFKNEKEIIAEILREVSKSGLSSFLVVLKTFGDKKSPGMLSFPKPGVTMAIDFRMTGERTLNALDKLDDIVNAAGGILYPAKDARMKGEDFRRYYPNWEEFSKFIDPKFSSSFWRRVTS